MEPSWWKKFDAPSLLNKLISIGERKKNMKKFAATLCALCLAPAAFAGPKVGLVQLVEHPSLDEIRTALVAELQAQVPDVQVDYQNGQNSPSLINSICQKFVGAGVDAIVAIATPAAQGAMAATSDIPVIFAAVTDPVSAGLVQNLEQPEANATGTSDLIPANQVLDLAAQMTPDVKTFGLIYNPGEVNSRVVVDQVKELLSARGLNFAEATVTNSSEVASATSALLGKADALFVPIDNTVASAMPTVSELAIESHKPVYAAADSLVRDGALATVGVNYRALGKETGDMVAQILKGAAVKDVPVRVMSTFDRVFNDDTAAQLGIDLSAYRK